MTNWSVVGYIMNHLYAPVFLISLHCYNLKLRDFTASCQAFSTSICTTKLNNTGEAGNDQ